METLYIVFMVGLVACSALCLYRVAGGPTAADRMVAIDVLGTVLVGFVAILTVLTDQAFLLEVAIVWALVSSVGTLALAKHLEGRAPDE
jgi:multicomponent Na+:H+ antiporter subunit F